MNSRASIINSESIKIRFLTTLFVNIGRIGLNVLAGIIIARGLDPSGYGNFNFLLVSFSSIIHLMDMGTSTGFYTFLSQRKRSEEFYLYYVLWIVIQFLLVLVFIGLVFPEFLVDKIWLGHTKGRIILAFLASFMMNKVWLTATQAGEAIRATVIVQLHNIILSGLYLCLVITMVFLHRLTIANLFTSIVFLYLLFTFILAKRLKDNLIGTEEGKLPNIIREFKVYCTPLIIYGIVSFAYSWADVWLLQKYGGAVQQGFYSVGLRFSAICLIATTSMLQVFWKEIAEAHDQGDTERLYYLYARISRSLCFVAAVGACFLVPFSKEILVLFLGTKYEAGWLCLAIMFLFPIHQSLGQINGSYFHATAETKLYSKIGIIRMAISVPVTYFFLASPSALIKGLGLGSVGLALKMVVLNIISVNILGYFICKISQWKFDFLYQFESIGLLLVASFMVKWFVGWVSHFSGVFLHPLVFIILCVPIYILMVGMILYLFPRLSGMGRGEILNLVRVSYGYLGRISR